MIDTIYVVPGSVALVEWLLAAALYAVGWYRAKYGLDRVGDGLVLAGLVTALAGVAWLAWDFSPGLVLTRSSLATGLAVSVLAVYGVLAHRRTERLSAFVMLALTVPIQAYAVGRLWWGVEVVPSGTFLPLWMAFRVIAGLVGYGGLAVGAMLITLSFTLSRVRDRLSLERLTAAMGLLGLEWWALRIALVALSVSLSVGLIRSWWGRSQVMTADFTWALITWLLLAAGVYGLIQGAIPRRPARVLLIFACATAFVAVLTTAGPLAGID